MLSFEELIIPEEYGDIFESSFSANDGLLAA